MAKLWDEPACYFYGFYSTVSVYRHIGISSLFVVIGVYGLVSSNDAPATTTSDADLSIWPTMYSYIELLWQQMLLLPKDLPDRSFP